MKPNLPELRERLQRQQQVLSKIEQQWLELDKQLTELESKLPHLPEVEAQKVEAEEVKSTNAPRKPR